MTQEVEHKGGSNEDEQMVVEKLPLGADIVNVNQIQTARTTFKEKSLSENNFFQQFSKNSLIPKPQYFQNMGGPLKQYNQKP